jgi:hypothetical protein
MKAEGAHQRSHLLFAITAVVNSTWVFLSYLSVNRIGTLEPATLARTLEATAERPYIYRVLIPLLSQIFAPLIPGKWIDWLHRAPTSIQNSFGWLSDGGYERQAAVILILIFLSLVGFAFAERKLLQALGTGTKEQYVLALLAQILILPFSIQFSYYYDIPQVLLVTLCLLFLYQQQWWQYILTLAIASFNKETSLFLIAVFCIYYLPRLPLRKFIELLFAQAAIYATIRASLFYIFRNNPGTAVPLTWEDHYRQYASVPSSMIFTLIFFCLIGFLLTREWRRKHEFLRATIVIPALILILFFTSGMPMEFRVFLDALPALVILGFPQSGASSATTETEAAQIVVK